MFIFILNLSTLRIGATSPVIAEVIFFETVFSRIIYLDLQLLVVNEFNFGGVDRYFEKFDIVLIFEKKF